MAYVCFKTPDAVGLALELKDTMLDERPIFVERYSVKKLGAKAARDAEAAAAPKATGAKQRLNNKNQKGKQKQPNAGKDKEKDENKKKKGEFRGVKVDGMKQKKKNKKKLPSQMAQLAKKIAPKTEKSD